MTLYSPKKAWIRASIYFAVCLAISWGSGTMHSLFNSPITSEQQVASPSWWAATAFVTAYVIFAYTYFWPKGTLNHGRPLHLGHVLFFGFFWGACQGQLALVLFRAIEWLNLAAVWNVLIMLVIYSALTAIWHSRYWDIHVSPDHNIYEWNARKVLVSHVPFLVLATAHLAIYNNPAIFVAWQVIALMASTYTMRFPAPGDPESPAHDGQGIRQGAENA